MTRNDHNFALIGPGRLGLRLAHGLVEAGWRCTKVRGRRSPQNYDHGLLPTCTPWDSWNEAKKWQTPSLILVTVEDKHIELVAELIAKLLADELPSEAPVVLHTSGLLTSDSLHPCRAAGAHVASWHPLQSFTKENCLDFSGVPCAIEGDEPAVNTGFRIAAELGLAPWIIDRNHKALYHAAAVVGANLSHILIRTACDILSSCGDLPAQPSTMLAPLIRASFENALKAEGLEHLTGPIARGDEITIQKHLEVLPDNLRSVYESLVAIVNQNL
jgi:predicted short-subunit dehydrogenase-like oxidoreductase (DUF2520 family)